MADSADSDGNSPSKLFPESSKVVIAVRPEMSGMWPETGIRCTRVVTVCMMIALARNSRAVGYVVVTVVNSVR